MLILAMAAAALLVVLELGLDSVPRTPELRTLSTALQLKDFSTIQQK